MVVGVINRVKFKGTVPHQFCIKPAVCCVVKILKKDPKEVTQYRAALFGQYF